MRVKLDLSSLSYLVLEDNAHMRTIVRSILAGFGVRRIYEAADAVSALELILDRSPDLIICDWAMSPMSGAEFLRILRGDQDPHIATTPVIICTAHTRRSVVNEAVECGIHGFLAKPLSPSVLYDRVCDVILREEKIGRRPGYCQIRTMREEDLHSSPDYLIRKLKAAARNHGEIAYV